MTLACLTSQVSPPCSTHRCFSSAVRNGGRTSFKKRFANWNKKYAESFHTKRNFSALLYNVSLLWPDVSRFPKRSEIRQPYHLDTEQKGHHLLLAIGKHFKCYQYSNVSGIQMVSIQILTVNVKCSRLIIFERSEAIKKHQIMVQQTWLVFSI